MITKLYTIEQLKQWAAEILLNNTDAVTKVEETSVLNAICYAQARLAQVALKENALVESQILVDKAFGGYLDNVARMNGVAERFGATGSSVYLYLSGESGTYYSKDVVTFQSNNGIVFEMTKDAVIGDAGFTYAKVRSRSVGLSSNVKALTITRITNAPNGHQYAINEYQAVGGQDSEADNAFRERIKQKTNILAKSTISALEEALKIVNSSVLKVFFQGSINGKTKIAVLAQNGVDYTKSELNLMLLGIRSLFSFTEIRPNNANGESIELVNVEYYPIDLSFRCILESGADPIAVRQSIQVKSSKYIDYRNWSGGKVEWDTLLTIVKNTVGVKYVFDYYFYPRQDISIPKNKLPRIRGFRMLNQDGSIINEFTGQFNPVYYPAEADFSYQKTVLRQI